MRDLDLFAQYLIKYRQERLQQSHATLIGTGEDWADKARILATHAEVADRLLSALHILESNPDRFIKEFLQ